MRGLIVLSLIVLATGCHTPKACRSEMGDGACCPGGLKEGPCSTSGGEGQTSSNQCATPNVEFRGGETVHIKAPAQKVVIETAAAPSPAAQTQIVQPANSPVQPAYAQPMQPAYTQPVALAPVAAAAPMASPPMFMQPATPQMVMASSTQTTSPPGARLALGFDSFNIRIPFPKFFAVAGPQEVTTRTQYVTQQQTAMAPVTMAAAPVAVAQPMYAQPQYAVPAQTFVAQPQAQIMAPAQAMAVQPQMQVGLPPCPPNMSAMAQPQAGLPPCPQTQAAQTAARDQNVNTKPQPTQQQIDDLTKQVQALENTLNTPPKPAPQWHR